MNILFVCTGNIFRSMSAEYLMKKYCKDHEIKIFNTSSAGTIANPELPFPQTIKSLSLYGCDPKRHKQRKITKNILKNQDIIICMAKHHQKSVKDLGFDSVLFNKIAYNKNKDLLDDAEYLEKYGEIDINNYFKSIIDYIYNAIPHIVKNLKGKTSQ